MSNYEYHPALPWFQGEYNPKTHKIEPEGATQTPEARTYKCDDGITVGLPDELTLLDSQAVVGRKRKKSGPRNTVGCQNAPAYKSWAVLT